MKVLLLQKMHDYTMYRFAAHLAETVLHDINVIC